MLYVLPSHNATFLLKVLYPDHLAHKLCACVFCVCQGCVPPGSSWKLHRDVSLQPRRPSSISFTVKTIRRNCF